jgi:hypothetical protein
VSEAQVEGFVDGQSAAHIRQNNWNEVKLTRSVQKINHRCLQVLVHQFPHIARGSISSGACRLENRPPGVLSISCQGYLELAALSIFLVTVRLILHPGSDAESPLRVPRIEDLLLLPRARICVSSLTTVVDNSHWPHLWGKYAQSMRMRPLTGVTPRSSCFVLPSVAEPDTMVEYFPLSVSRRHWALSDIPNQKTLDQKIATAAINPTH